jgi:hypothetical protein
MSEAATDGRVVRLALHCAVRVAQLLARRQLHLSRNRIGETVETPDGRRFIVFRESSSSEPGDGRLVTLAVWFHLRGMPARARLRRFLFERESILNTVLFAGFEGYRTKLWAVDPRTNDYAGLYTWCGRESAERYARYITAVLRPLSVRGSVGYALAGADDDLDE